jgi:hypothetical protein
VEEDTSLPYNSFGPKRKRLFMATLNDLAELLFPDVTKTIADLEKEYPARQLCRAAPK